MRFIWAIVAGISTTAALRHLGLVDDWTGVLIILAISAWFGMAYEMNRWDRRRP